MSAPEHRLRRPSLPLVGGIVLAIGGLGLLAVPRVAVGALGLEALAMAFWVWARASDDRREQLARWAWLRRPAMAMWLAAALVAALPAPRAAAPAPRPGLAGMLETPEMLGAGHAGERDPLGPLRALRSLAVLWAALELLGALPGTRPFPDVPGPMPVSGPWLPALLPAAGFLLMWRQAPVWTDAPLVRELAAAALALAGALAVLRAYSRRTWTASLRWLATFDSAMAGMLVALSIVPGTVAFMLWTAAAGGRLMALAAELRGSAARRGAGLTNLWRLTGWTAGATLSWPLLCGVGFSGGQIRPVEFTLLAAPVFLASSLSLRRVVEAPERRALARPDAVRLFGMAGAIATLVLGPLALVDAWWSGFEASFPGVVIAMLPALLALWPLPPARAADAPVRERGAEGMPAPPPGPRELHGPLVVAPTREFAIAVFRAVTAFENRLAGSLGALARALGAPARDLHTGDAQEYLLFLVGVGVLAILLPLLR